MTETLSERISPPDWVNMVARREPGRPCFIRPNSEVVTYGEVRDRLHRVASALSARGIGFGDRVAVLGVDSPEYMITVLAAMRIGVVVAPLNFRLSNGEIANLVNVTEPAAIFYSSRYATTVGQIVEDLGRDIVYVALDEVGDGALSFRQLAEQGSDEELPPLTTDDDILTVLLTSGTTGTPKGVLQSQRMIKAVTHKGIIEQDFRSDDLFYSGTPLFHVAGLGYAFYGLARGASVLLLPQFDAPTVLRWLQHGGVSRCMFVPSMIIAMLDLPEARQAPFPSLRSIMYGGAPIHPSTLRDMIDVFQCDLYNGFGAGTEAGGQSIFRPEDHAKALKDSPHLLGSIGKAQYGVDLKLCDEQGNEVPVDAIGEIWTRADTIMSGFLTPFTGDRPPIVEGWFRGGDMARRDAEGYLYLAGRRDDMVLRGGENIYPFDIEGVLQSHTDVADVAVFGLPDPYWGEVVAAAIVRSEGSDLTDAELQAFARSNLAKYKVPERVFFVQELPRTSSGKADKPKLKRTYSLESDQHEPHQPEEDRPQ